MQKTAKYLFYSLLFVASGFLLFESIFALSVFGTSRFYYRLYVMSVISTMVLAFIIAYVGKAHPWFLIAVFLLVFGTFGYSAIYLGRKPKKIEERKVAELEPAAFKDISLESETFQFRVTEPVSFIVAGSEEAIKSLLAADGWTEAEPLGLKNSFEATWRGLNDKDYPSAPVSPSFWAGREHAFAYSKTEGTVKRRHHLRVFKTPFSYTGKNIFFITASFDAGPGIGLYVHIPIHKIAPDIDAERRQVFDTFLRSGKVSSAKLHPTVGPKSGRNAFGHKFTTDGKAYFIELGPPQ